MFEVLFGGQAGGGKSSALVATPLRWASKRGFRAIMFRRETPQLLGLLEEASKLYPRIGGAFHGGHLTYSFAPDATVQFAHCQRESDAFKYQGREWALICFDELTHFTVTQYLELLSRCRSSAPGLPRGIRATTNPGGEGHAWVFERWGAWLDPEFERPGGLVRIADPNDIHSTIVVDTLRLRGLNGLPPLGPCQVGWVVKDVDEREHFVAKGTPGGESRTFIPSSLSDNKQLALHDPQYARRLENLDPVRKAQLKNGNWLIKPAAGLYFRREWTTFVDAAPISARRIRYWDRAATEARPGNDPDWTVGVKMAIDAEKHIFIEDVVRIRGNPGTVEKTIRATTEMDGIGVQVGIEQDPGQAGKFEAAYYIKELAGFNVRAFPVSGDKVTRFGPFSAQAEARNVRIVRGQWNEPYIRTLESFPTKGVHDDDADATSGAYAALTGKPMTMLDAITMRAQMGRVA